MKRGGNLYGLLGLSALALAAAFGATSASAQTATAATTSSTKSSPAAPKPRKKQEASIAPKEATGEKKLPTTNVTANGGRMLNPYSEQPETRYIKIPVNSKACTHLPGKPYFVEFRARNAASWGHTFVLYGKLGGGNRFASYKVAGLHPKGDSTQYTIGIWVPVPAETGPSDGDIDEQFLAGKFCVPLTEAEYKQLVPFIKKLQSSHSTWHGAGYNCNSFGMDIAKFVGLDAPNPNMHVPQELIKLLAKDNKNRPHDPVGKDSNSFF